MRGKPFRPPLLNRKSTQFNDVQEKDAHPAKRRRISQEEDEVEKVVQPSIIATQLTNNFRKPLLSVINTTSTQPSSSKQDAGVEAFYTVLWRKFTNRKNKIWDGDGVLLVSGGYAKLHDSSGKEMGKASCTAPLLPGSMLSVGGRDIEVDSVISRQEFLAGKSSKSRNAADARPEAPMAKFKPPTTASTNATKRVKLETQQQEKINSATSQSKATMSGFRTPLLSSTILPRKEKATDPVPRHDPHDEGALVMCRPTQAPNGKRLVDVVVDPLLSKRLREHQRQGISFLYECVMGMRDYAGEGAILADEMGLGKTLQTIALLWTLLKQNPIFEDAPVIKKALIVCPVTLINNWRKEFKKWLGNERIGVFVADDKKTRLTDFTMGKSYRVMIIGYEKLRSVQEDLKKGAGIDIVIADEGHRLKTAQNKSALAIKSLNTERRIILSGTPIQNDLSEFYTMVDFVNPGLLGRYNTFKREFEGPIVKSRQPEASASDVKKGEDRSTELASLTGQFILRRTAEILAKYLPPKTEYVLFCRPTSAQASVYRSIVSSPAFGSVLGSSEASLQLINILKKVCNGPSLLKSKVSDDASPSPLMSEMLSSIPQSALSYPGASAKLQVLDNLLHHIRTNRPEEKIVIVSNYTSTLNMLGALLSSLSYPFLRLDGTTPTSQRQSLVDRFNRTPSSATFAFLLSAKTGGTGLNLIGASRLVLFDADWNPATDAQAMARIHRDGQKRPVSIYRLILKGAMDEKIFQRQRMKMGLADAVVDGKKSAQGFSREELRDLFRLEEGGGCRTHDLLGCFCGGKGGGSVEMERGGVKGDDENTDNDSETQTDASDEDLLTLPTLITASQLDANAQGRKIMEDVKRASASTVKEQKMQTLMQYNHVDTSLLASEAVEGMEAGIKDEVLLNMLKDSETRIEFVFAKTSS
ncbi:hypothetical protein EV356DRAFT_536401 [Viridothelium virens]|uniref:DNA repair and recombination protein RAD26 n=1 Tax=Viridothelium virens TaxID=1048519 RepID=A0A6A6GXK4_VIRVR|nr:hypothetical protein EV356DRAFT_536401 [Viridothelium virens]